ncbi:hypothetical protein HD554DRAFT_2023048, partial [Boletus coccyginus]
WQSKPAEVARAVATALRVGYRHPDCVWWGVRHEKEVGQGLKASGVPRENIYSTKLWCTYHTRAKCLDQALANVGTDYFMLPSV